MTQATERHNTPPEHGIRPGAQIDPQTLMRIKSLEMRAKVVVEGFMGGLHRSPFHGFSVEFTEYRQYTPGDDPRYLDWKLFARSDRYYIKRFEDETNLRCHLLVDQSRSMSYGSLSYSKRDYAATLAATLGYFLSTQRDAVGAVTFDETIVDYLPPRYRPGHLRRLMLTLERPAEGKGTDLTVPLQRVAELVTKRGLVVLVSDLLADIDALQESLGGLCARGHDVVLFQVLDPAELSFEFSEPAMFHDVESGRDLYVDPAAIREQYLQKFEEHNGRIAKCCDNLGIEYHRISTDTPLENALSGFLQNRAAQGKRTVRAQSRGRAG